MAITAEQRAARKLAIGSSDMAAVLGACKSLAGREYRTSWDVWAEKTGRIAEEAEPTIDDAESVEEADTPEALEEASYNLAILTGNALEPFVLDLAEKKLGKLVRSPETITRPDLYMACNLDAYVEDTGKPVEAKTAGLMGMMAYGEWGSEWSDEVPPRYLIQVHQQMVLADKDEAYLPALLFGKGFRVYRIVRNEALADLIVRTAKTFWERFVMTDTPPDDSIPTLEVVKKIHRKEGKVVTLEEAGPIGDFIAARDTANAAKKAADEAKRRLAGLMVDATEIIGPDGRIVAKPSSRSTFNKDLVAADYPDIAANKKYYKVSHFPIFQVK